MSAIGAKETMLRQTIAILQALNIDYGEQLEKLKARIKELETEIKNYAPFKCSATDLEDSEWKNL